MLAETMNLIRVAYHWGRSYGKKVNAYNYDRFKQTYQSEIDQINKALLSDGPDLSLMLKIAHRTGQRNGALVTEENLNDLFARKSVKTWLEKVKRTLLKQKIANNICPDVMNSTHPEYIVIWV